MKVYIRPPDWWPEPVPEGHVLLLLKSIYGTKQAARRWHLHISGWMEKNCHTVVNSEKTIFIKNQGDYFIVHCLLSVLKSHFKRACIGLFKQLLSKRERRFVRTHWLQASRRSCETVWVRTVLFVGKSEFRFRRFKKDSRALATRTKARLLE